MRCPCRYPSKHQHLGFVKIFLELPGTKAGPKRCLSQCLIIIAVTQYTQHKKEEILLFFSYSLSQSPFPSPSYWAPFAVHITHSLPSSTPHSGSLAKQLEKSHLALKGYFLPHCFCTIQNYCFQK